MAAKFLAAVDTATCEAAKGLVSGKCLGNGPDIAEAQIEQLLQGLKACLRLCRRARP
jgi:hypothetical protein